MVEGQILITLDLMHASIIKHKYVKSTAPSTDHANTKTH